MFPLLKRGMLVETESTHRAERGGGVGVRQSFVRIYTIPLT